MTYDFETIMDRSGKDALAVDAIGAGVAWQQGAPFHDEWGIRMNLAVPYSLVTEAFSRLKRFVFV